MKKTTFAAMGIAAAMLLGACGSGAGTAETGMTGSQAVTEETETVLQEPETGEEETEAGASEPEAVVEAFMDMLGRTDEETAKMLGGGEENRAADGTLIGRIFRTELFGETVEAGTLCDSDQRVTVVTMQLDDPAAETYLDDLIGILGEPDIDETGVSESGSTATVWEDGSCTVRLYQSYGLVSLEFQLNQNIY